MNDNKKAFKMFLIPILCGFTVIVAAIFAKNITVQKSMSVVDTSTWICSCNENGAITSIGSGYSSLGACKSACENLGLTFESFVEPTASSSSSTSSTISVTRIRFTSGSDHIQMRVGQEYTLLYSISPSNATNKNVTFSTDASGIATVSSTGVVRAKSPGVATISIKTNDASCTDTDDCSDSVAIEVLEANTGSSSSYQEPSASETGCWCYSNQFGYWEEENITSRTACETACEDSGGSVFIFYIPVIRIRFASESDHIQMRVGQEYPLLYNIYPNYATNKNVTFSTDASGIATVSSTGVVRAKSPGVATISIKTNDASCTDTDDCSDSVAIEVLEANTGSSSSSTTGPTSPTTVEYTLTYNVNGGNACSPTTKTATSGSKWGTLCTPTRSGYTFKEWNTKKNGSGTKVTSSSIASSNMTVYAQWTSSGSSTVSVTGIVLTPSTWKMQVGDTKELEAIVTPTNATNKNVVWTSSDTSVATVNANGVVTGISPGTATITVTTIDGNKSATSKITVLANSEETPTNENEYVIITEVYYGNITDSDVVTEGSDKTIEYSPNEGYKLSEIKIDGESISTEGNETQYTFEDVSEDHYITVIYVKEGDNTNPKTGVFEVGGILLIIVTFGGIAYFLTQKKKISNI